MSYPTPDAYQYDWRDDDDPILGKVRMLRHEMMVAAVKAMQS